MEFVREDIGILHQRFNDLKRSCIVSMEKRGISLNVVVDALRSLPADGTKVHPHFTDSYLSVFSQAINHSELFGTLGFNMNYFSFQLLDYLVHEFDLEEVKPEMERYKSDVQQFRQKTPINLFCQAAQNRDLKPPPNFRVLISVFKGSDDMMLEDVEQFREEYSRYYGFQNFTMTLAEVKVGSVSVTWFIPESVVEQLMGTKGVPRFILYNYSVIKLEVDGGCVYRIHKVGFCSGYISVSHYNGCTI